jgi:flagellar biosynthesis GTPase FlhF
MPSILQATADGIEQTLWAMQREPWRDLWRAAGSRFAKQLEEWWERAADQLGDDDAVDSLIKQTIGRQGMPDGGVGVDVRATARDVIAVLEAVRATWSRWNLLAEIERETRHIPTTTPAERTGLHVHPAVARQAVAEVEQTAGLTLDSGQRSMAEGFVLDDRRIVAAVGPAGSGKTTAMRAPLVARGKRPVAG